MTITTPMDVLNETTGLDHHVRDKATEYLHEWTGWQYGLSPKVAAASAYYAAGLHATRYGGPKTNAPTQLDVASLFDTGKQSISDNYRDILDEVRP